MPGCLALLRAFLSGRLNIKEVLFFLFHSFLVTIGIARGAMEPFTPKFLAYLVILCFDRQCPEQNTVAHLSQSTWPQKNIWVGNATVCNHFHTDGLHLSRAQPCSSISKLSHGTFLLNVQSSTDKKLAQHKTARHCRIPM